MIEVQNLSKRYGDNLAVEGLDFVVQPGIVTGFLGPNGAGKSTTMRMIAGLDKPTQGQVRVNGRSYRTSTAPMAELGTLLEAKAVHTGRSARLGPGVTVSTEEDGVLTVQGLSPEDIGTIAWREHLPVFELTPKHASLEDAFMKLTHDSVDYRSHESPAAAPAEATAVAS